MSKGMHTEAPINDKSSFILSGRRTYADQFLRFARDTSLRENQLYFYDFNAKANYEISDKDRIYLSGYFGRDVFKFGGGFGLNWGNSTATLRWNHIFNNKLFSNLSFIYSRYNYNLEISADGIDWTSDIDNYNIRYDLGYYLNDNLKFDFGVSGIYYTFNPGQLDPLGANSAINPTKLDDKFAVEAGAYVSLEHKISDKLTAEYGLRYSYFNRLGNQTLNTYANNLPVVYNDQLRIYERANPTGETTYGSGESIAT
ncbi:MAG: hypothetical protein AAGM22_06460, partial [Acidobacteriota bacterium]